MPSELIQVLLMGSDTPRTAIAIRDVAEAVRTRQLVYPPIAGINITFKDGTSLTVPYDDEKERDEELSVLKSLIGGEV